MPAGGADLGEEIELAHNTPDLAPYGQRSVTVRGIVNTPERKAQLSGALREIPHV